MNTTLTKNFKCFLPLLSLKNKNKLYVHTTTKSLKCLHLYKETVTCIQTPLNKTVYMLFDYCLGFFCCCNYNKFLYFTTKLFTTLNKTFLLLFTYTCDIQ